MDTIHLDRLGWMDGNLCGHFLYENRFAVLIMIQLACKPPRSDIGQMFLFGIDEMDLSQINENLHKQIVTNCVLGDIAQVSCHSG